MALGCPLYHVLIVSKMSNCKCYFHLSKHFGRTNSQWNIDFGSILLVTKICITPRMSQHVCGPRGDVFHHNQAKKTKAIQDAANDKSLKELEQRTQENRNRSGSLFFLSPMETKRNTVAFCWGFSLSYVTPTSVWVWFLSWHLLWVAF